MCTTSLYTGCVWTMFQRKTLSRRLLRAANHEDGIFGSEKMMALLAVAAVLDQGMCGDARSDFEALAESYLESSLD